MGTISDKLTYLNTTKIKLRDSLNKFGSSILSTDTFRSYDTKLNDIYDKLPKITQSGAGLTITPVQNGQVDDFKMNGVDLQQSGTPTPDNPQEIKVVEGRQVITDKGKNLCELKNQTITNNGVTFTIQDGVVTANGTYTANTLTQFEQNDNLIFNGNYIVKTFLISGTVSNTANFNLKDNSNITLTNSTINSSMSSTFSIQNSKIITGVYAQNNTVFDNLKFKVQIEEGSTATDYEPYYEPVSYNIDLHGKNEFDGEYEDGYYNMNGTKPSTQDPYGRRSTNLNKIEPNTNYSISINNNIISETIRLFYYDANRGFISTESISNGTFTTPAECYYVSWHSSSLKQNYPDGIPNMMIEQGQTVTTYEDYYDYKLAKMPNTTYKNRIYKNNGNWYFEENVKKVVLDGSENWVKNSYSFYWSGDMFSNKPVSICSHFIDYGPRWTSSDENLRGKYTTTNAIQFKCMPLEDMTLNEFKTWLSTHNVDVWCQLDIPITTQITNTTLIDQLEAISVHTGTNIITISNDNNIIPELEITRLKELEKLA